MKSLALFCLMSNTALSAAAQQRLPFRDLATTCISCHSNSNATALPALAGQPPAQMAASMRAFRSDVRPATVMQQLVKGLSEAQIEGLAQYFSAQPRAH